jgi:hypothetical protein
MLLMVYIASERKKRRDSMSQPQSGDVQIPIPFGSLLKAIDQLPTESLVQLLHITEETLSTRTSQKSEQPATHVEDERFWEDELGQYIAAEADTSVSIEEVRNALSTIPGSLAAEIRRERDER